MNEPEPYERSIGTFLAGLGLGALLVLFGGYLIYDRVVLSLTSGSIEERSGVIEETGDPLFYWLSVGMYGVFGGIIAVLGLWCLWRVIRPR